MLAYIIRRLWQMIPTMLGVILLIFFLFNWVGGDPAYILAGKMANLEQIENARGAVRVEKRATRVAPTSFSWRWRSTKQQVNPVQWRHVLC